MATFSRLFGLSFKGASLNVVRRLCVQQQHVNKQLLNAINISKPVWLCDKQNNLNLPASNITFINLPSGLIWTPSLEEPSNNLAEVTEAPISNIIDNTKQAASLIVIRRKKMKKHKLRKLRKRMKFVNAKIRHKREMRKEKEFQAVLVQQCKVAESFSAEEHVSLKLRKFGEAQGIPNPKETINTLSATK